MAFQSTYLRGVLHILVSHLSDKSSDCINPHAIDTRQPKEFVDSMASHDWVPQYTESMKGMGIIVRYRCSKCGTEWSNIVTVEYNK